MKGYPWDIGTRLANQVLAGNLGDVEESTSLLINYICDDTLTRSVSEMKLRVVQVLTIASRAVYDAGGNPDRLFDINLEFIREIAEIEDKSGMLRIARHVICELMRVMTEVNGAGSYRIGKALAYIETHCTDEITRADVSDVVSCSPSHLSRLFSQITGHTFSEVVLNHKLNKAKDLLSDTDMSITQIAFELGYKDPNYFSFSFKRHVGVTATEYRRSVYSAEIRGAETK